MGFEEQELIIKNLLRFRRRNQKIFAKNKPSFSCKNSIEGFLLKSFRSEKMQHKDNEFRRGFVLLMKNKP